MNELTRNEGDTEKILVPSDPDSDAVKVRESFGRNIGRFTLKTIIGAAVFGAVGVGLINYGVEKVRSETATVVDEVTKLRAKATELQADVKKAKTEVKQNIDVAGEKMDAIEQKATDLTVQIDSFAEGIGITTTTTTTIAEVPQGTTTTLPE